MVCEQHISGFFTGVFPMVPDIQYGVVDVRDVATMHVLAMEKPEVSGCVHDMRPPRSDASFLGLVAG